MRRITMMNFSIVKLGMDGMSDRSRKLAWAAWVWDSFVILLLFHRIILFPKKATNHNVIIVEITKDSKIENILKLNCSETVEKIPMDFPIADIIEPLCFQKQCLIKTISPKELINELFTD
jgi:hypothetical protein